ncbi:MAG TPA: DUF2203 domain-containing protein [Terriglobales bacterium]|nr:DUF2203 domain-containing protein [Terriglobales bacterium]
MAEKTFTLEEAQSLLPVLESLLRSATEGKKLAEAIDAEFQEIAHRVFLNGGTFLKIVPLAKRRSDRDKAVQTVKDAITEISSIGVQVKDLDMGLLDFPCAVDGQIILLCWKLGEKTIEFWHGLEEGYAGRKPIDDRIGKSNPERPN